MKKTVLFLNASTGKRAVSIIRDDSMPVDMRFETIFQVRGGAVAWKFSKTRKEADALASEMR